jgi:uncharacterized protein
MPSEITFGHGEVILAGAIWLPDGPGPYSGLVMVGGSGPSDRHNDTLFPPIRAHLLSVGIAVLSDDKRGVGGSSGSWLTTGYDGLASDCLAAVDALQSCAEVDALSVGLFAHSEGGWVALRAAARRRDLAYVITNSTPGISPVRQERWAMTTAARAHGIAEAELEAVVALYDRLVVLARIGASFAEVAEAVADDPAYATFTRYGTTLSEPGWEFMKLVLDHDPLPDIERLRCQHLAIFGSADTIVPVVESVAAIATATCRHGQGGLTVEIFPGADHRINSGITDRFASGYLEALTAWIQRALRSLRSLRSASMPAHLRSTG